MPKDRFKLSQDIISPFLKSSTYSTLDLGGDVWPFSSPDLPSPPPSWCCCCAGPGGVSEATPSLRMSGGEKRREELPPPSTRDLLGVSGLEICCSAGIAEGGQLEARLFLAVTRRPGITFGTNEGEEFSFSRLLPLAVLCNWRDDLSS